MKTRGASTKQNTQTFYWILPPWKQGFYISNRCSSLRDKCLILLVCTFGRVCLVWFLCGTKGDIFVTWPCDIHDISWTYFSKELPHWKPMPHTIFSDNIELHLLLFGLHTLYLSLEKQFQISKMACVILRYWKSLMTLAI